MFEPLSRMTRSLAGLRRQVLLHRRLLAGVLAGLAVLVAVQAASAPAADTVPVWTASRDLPAGSVLPRDALHRVPFLRAHVPARAIDSPAAVVGRTLAAPLVRGQAVTRGAVVSRGWLRGHPGLTAVPVRLTDPAVAALLHPGDRVSLLAADPQHPGGATVLADRAVVLVVPRAPTVDAGTLTGRLVVFGVPPVSTDTIAAASASKYLTVAWSR